MTPERRARLEAAGHKVQSAADFFGLDEVDRRVVEVRLEVARLIRALRAEQGITQRDLAARMEVSQARIVGIEHGKNASLDAMLTAYLALGGQFPDFGVAPRRRLIKRRPTCLDSRRLRPPAAPRQATRTKLAPPARSLRPARTRGIGR